MTIPTPPQLTVFYDGLCVLCSREIQVYRKRDRAGRIHFEDISVQSFDAKALGLSPTRVQEILHVQRSNGEIFTGVAAFVEIWKVLPGFGGLARWAQKSWVRPMMEFGYQLFALARPYLPRRKCSESCDIALR